MRQHRARTLPSLFVPRGSYGRTRVVIWLRRATLVLVLLVLVAVGALLGGSPALVRLAVLAPFAFLWARLFVVWFLPG